MDNSWIILGLVILGIIVLVPFLLLQNKKDKKELTKSLNEDYKKYPGKDSEINDGEIKI